MVWEGGVLWIFLYLTLGFNWLPSASTKRNDQQWYLWVKFKCNRCICKEWCVIIYLCAHIWQPFHFCKERFWIGWEMYFPIWLLFVHLSIFHLNYPTICLSTPLLAPSAPPPSYDDVIAAGQAHFSGGSSRPVPFSITPPPTTTTTGGLQ